ncbi:uncharacterized protein MKZ38_008010 [Zalerion maritima]|uniref:Uncharacterized protein n=1 Tax=Zalerion maritima TaxID=339359 RepID=A0AAD5WWB6_9PEZI|nr:uncharacterized protein MKZ38_008010 [Zalerion maritima]
MGRRLPWKKEASSGAGSPATTPRLSSARGLPRIPTTPAAPKTGSTKITNSDRLERPVKSPSTSPPPAPPEEEYMIDGMDQDGRWRMVEDEFVSVARRFTAHLHAAEYQRLKKAAKEKNEQYTSKIARPVIGVMSEPARKRKERSELKTRQMDALKRARVQDEEDDASPWTGTHLHNLMESPGRQPSKLTSAISIHSSTRASAGFKSTSQSQEGGLFARGTRDPIDLLEINDEDDTDESNSNSDLGTASILASSKTSTTRQRDSMIAMLDRNQSSWNKKSRKEPTPPVRTNQERVSRQNISSSPSIQNLKSSTFPVPSRPGRQSLANEKVEPQNVPKDDEDDGGFGFMNAMAQRRKNSRRRRPLQAYDSKPQPKVPDLDDIPFL